jgi:hypothetical protein
MVADSRVKVTPPGETSTLAISVAGEMLSPPGRAFGAMMIGGAALLGNRGCSRPGRSRFYRAGCVSIPMTGISIMEVSDDVWNCGMPMP